MMARNIAALLAIMLCCSGASAARPIRHLLQQTPPVQVGYVPQGAGCDGLIVTTTAKSDSSWFQSGPIIEGNVELWNPKTYGIPVANILVEAQSSDGQFYSAYATCQNGEAGTYVPTNPQPYSYGTQSCIYRIQLDHRVFSSYNSNTMQGQGQAGGQGQAVGYFPSNNNNNNNNNGYYPNHPTWAVTAVATIGMSNAQCPGAPVAVETSSWWSWFASWISGGNHNQDGSSMGSSSVGSSDSNSGSNAVIGSGVPREVPENQPALGSHLGPAFAPGTTPAGGSSSPDSSSTDSNGASSEVDSASSSDGDSSESSGARRL